MESQRVEPRVDYPADVRLTVPGLRSAIAGRSLNLGPSGVFVEADATCAVGTPLVCDIPLPGGRRRLRGRVARMQALPRASIGLGIEFLDLPGRDAAVLRELVDGADRGDRQRLVKVRFEGLKEELRSQATMTQRGVRLSTALPFLRLSSSVDVSFMNGEERSERRGVLRDVKIDRTGADGVPRLAVDVDLEGVRVAATDESVRTGDAAAEPALLSLDGDGSGTAGALPSRPQPSARRRVRLLPSRPGRGGSVAGSHEVGPPGRAAVGVRPGGSTPRVLPVSGGRRTPHQPSMATRDFGPAARPSERAGHAGAWFFVAVPAALVVLGGLGVSNHFSVRALERSRRDEGSQRASAVLPGAQPAQRESAALAAARPSPTPTPAAEPPPADAPSGSPRAAWPFSSWLLPWRRSPMSTFLR